MSDKREPTATGGRFVVTSRRTILKGIAVASLLAGGTGLTAADEHDDEVDDDEVDDDVEEPIVLGGKVDYWFGLSPEEYEGEENPTLELVDGETYEIVWINMDGEPHNIAIQDEDETDLEAVDDEVDEIGETQSLSFTASEEMDTYYCTIHPETQIGDLEIVEDDDDDDDDTDDDDIDDE